MGRTIEEIAAKMDALGLWEGVAQCNWALCPRGTVFPYFCTAIAESAGPARIRFMMVEGWQTFHDFVRTRIDVNFGFYSTPMEIPHFELVFVSGGEVRLFRHDPCFMLRLATDGIVGFSDRPLTLCGEFGTGLLVLTMLGLIALIVLACCKVSFPSWLWAVCGLVALNAITLLFLSLQGSYMNRMYDELKNRPLYIVAEELNMDK